MKIKLLRLFLAALFLLAPLVCNAQQQNEGEPFVKITELNTKSWIHDDPKSLIPEFEKSCRAIESYLNKQDKEFYGEDCISNLFIATTFIYDTNRYFDSLSPANAAVNTARAAVDAKFKKVLSEVVDKAINSGKASTEKENVNLIYTVIVTIQKDIVADYYHNVFTDPEEAKSSYLLAGAEDGRRVYRNGEYKAIYQKLGNK